MLVFLIIILSGSFTVAQDASFPRAFCIPTHFVASSRAFLRETPSSQGRALDVVPAGAQVVKLRQEQGESLTVAGSTSDLWYFVSYRDDLGHVTEGYVWSLLLQMLDEDTPVHMLIPEFDSTVVDRNGSVFELGGLRTETQATLETSFLREPLRNQVIALRQSDAVTHLVWLPLVQRLERTDDSHVTVTLDNGDVLSGEWIRSQPVKYDTESRSEFILGEPISGPSLQTVSLPHDTIQSIENVSTEAQRAAFQQIVNCTIAVFGETARHVEVSGQFEPPISGIFGFLVDGSGAYARFVWTAPHHPNLLLWSEDTRNCEVAGYPEANEIPVAEITSLTITDQFGVCQGRVVQTTLQDGAQIEGALISRDESYGGYWHYGANLGDDSVVVFSNFGVTSIRLSGVTSVTFIDL
jgi:hypothetical protein